MKTKTWTPLAMALVAAAGAVLAAPGTISTSLSPTGPILVGDPFTVTLSISGYTDATEIDGYNFHVAFDPIFTFVAGSLAANDAPGAHENWLRLAPQDDVGAAMLPLSDFTVQAGQSVDVSVSDLRLASTRGTAAASGFLYSFSLMANSLGIGIIAPSAGPGGTVLFDTAFSPAGVPGFSGAGITVVPEPATLVLWVPVVAALWLMQVGRRR